MPVSDDDFIAAWALSGNSPVAASKILGCDLRSVYARRSSLAKKGIVLKTISTNGLNGNNGHGTNYGWQTEPYAYRERADETVVSGTVVVFGDAHWWGPPSLAHRAMCLLIKQLKP